MLVTIADLFRGQETLQPYLERATQISGMFDRFVEEDEGDMHERKPGIHASELSCERRVVYSLISAPRSGKFHKRWKQRFKAGHAFHRMFQNDFLRMASKSRGLLEFEPEAKIGPEYQEIAALLRLESSADGIFTFRENRYGPAILRLGLEIKTESPDQFDKLQAPKPEHVTQAHLYMKALDLPLMWFLYVNKGNQNNTPSLAPWVIPFDENKWLTIEHTCQKALRAAQEYGATGQLPERNEAIWCEFCAYRETCGPDILRKKQEYAKPRAVRAP